MNFDKYDKRALLIAGGVIIVGSAFLVYQLTKSKDEDTVETKIITTKEQKNNNETTGDSKEDAMALSYNHMHAAGRSTSSKFAIEIYARMRPLTANEKDNKTYTMEWNEKKVNYNDTTVSFEIKTSLRRGTPNEFTKFESIMNDKIDNKQVFTTAIESNVNDALTRKNTFCVINYGHPNSGARHTMIGDSNNSNDGLYFQTANMLLDFCSNNENNGKIKLKMQYFDLNFNCGINVRDLLFSINNNNNDDDDNTTDEPEWQIFKNSDTGDVSIVAKPRPNNKALQTSITSLYPNNINEINDIINNANQNRDNAFATILKNKKTDSEIQIGHTFLVFECVNANNNNNNNNNNEEESFGTIVFVSLFPNNEFLKEKKKISKWRKVDTTTETQKRADKSLDELKEFMKSARKNGDFTKISQNGALCKLFQKYMNKDKENWNGVMIANVSPLRDDVKKNANTLKFVETMAIV